MDSIAERGAPDPTPSPFSVPIFRAVWIATIVSNFGTLIQSVGASWMMTTLTSSPQMIALVQASTTLPIMLLSLSAGAIADNMDRRRVMLFAQYFRLAVSIALTLCAYVHILGPGTLLGFTFLVGCGTAMNGPAWQSSVGDMVPRAILPSAVGYNGIGFNIARSTGPAVGGLLVAAAGVAAAFLCNVVSAVGLIMVLARWRPQRMPPTLPREPLSVAMAAGLRYVAMSPRILTVIARAAFFGLTASAIQALLPVVAKDLVGGGALIYGAMLGSFGLGAIAAALLSGRLRQRYSTETIVRVAACVTAIGAWGTGFSPWLPLTLSLLAFGGAGWVLALSTFNISVQMNAPRWVVGRSLALYQMAAFGGMAIGSWAFGLCADHIGASAALYAAAAGLVIVAATGLIWPMPEAAGSDLDPHGLWKPPHLSLPVELRSGPIVITIERRIASDDVERFLVAMNERRRIQQRNGARHWVLLRDLVELDLWIERYQLSTWVEYLRHNERKTFADVSNSEALLLLQRDGHPHRIHRMIERQVAALSLSGSAAAPIASSTGGLPG